MNKKPKMFTTGAIIEIIIAAFCIIGGSFIIIFNIIIYPKFNNLVYSVIGLFVLVIVLLLIAAHVIIKYKNATYKDDIEDYIENECVNKNITDDEITNKKNKE